MRRNRRKPLRSLAILLALFGFYLGAEFLCYRRAVLPGDVKTLDAYLWYRPGSDQFYLHTVKGDEFLEVSGPAGRLLPSGPAGYVFDCSGKLVDWTADSGDDSEYQRKWRASFRFRKVDRQQADEWIRKNVKSVSSRAG